MSARRPGYVGLCAAVAAWVALCLLFFSYVRQLEDVSPDLYLFTARGTGMPFGTIAGENGRAFDQLGIVSGLSRSYASVHGGAPESPRRVELLRVDAGYADLYRPAMKRGVFIDLWQVENGCQSAVIGEELAVGLFMSLDVIGEPLVIDGTVFEITGVVRDARSIPGQLASSGTPQVYIPYTAPMAFADVDSLTYPLSVLSVDGQAGAYKARSAVDRLAAQWGAAYTMSHPGGDAAYAVQWRRILLFFAALWVVCLMARMIARLAGLLYRAVRDGQGRNAPGAAKGKIGGAAAALASLPLLGWLLLSRTSFTLLIRSEYTPPDNIFDIGFYGDVIAGIFQRANASPVRTEAADILIRHAFTAMLVLCVAGIALWFVMLSRQKRAALLGSPLRHAAAAGIGIAAGLLLGAGLCALLGMEARAEYMGPLLTVIPGALYTAEAIRNESEAQNL